jgi:HlyD family secretion protein
MNPDRSKALQLDPRMKKRPGIATTLIFLTVLLIGGGALFMAWPREEDQRRLTGGNSAGGQQTSQGGGTDKAPRKISKAADTVLTVSGYIITRERIELSPRFMGVVKWIGVRKGDAVTNGQVVVLLDDAEYKARLLEVEGRLDTAKVAVEKAELDYARMKKLSDQKVEARQLEDDARLRVASARAAIGEIEGARALAKTYLDWTVIRSPIDGVVLERLVDANELVVPQSFGGARGPSTALIALADPNDLQVEIDLNEADLAKVRLGQKCRVSPEAFREKTYEGIVAEIAPEAARQKGTLQVKVQILKPDRFLTPELTAKVEFLAPSP